MNIPGFADVKVVNENGYLTDEWRNIMGQLFQQLQQNIGTEGFKVSLITAPIITIITPKTPNGTIIYDTTNNQFKGMKAGVLQTFTLT